MKYKITTPTPLYDKTLRYYEIPYDVLRKSFKELFNRDFNPNESFVDQGLDELDDIELLMTIENELDVSIPDDDWEEMQNTRDFNFLKTIQRNKKIDDLGI